MLLFTYNSAMSGQLMYFLPNYMYLIASVSSVNFIYLVLVDQCLS